MKRIHEEWRSEEMRLVLRVIDGDPSGIEKISGFEHMSLSPDSSLFTIPGDYELQHPDSVGEYVDGDLRSLSHWAVTQEPLSPEDSR